MQVAHLCERDEDSFKITVIHDNQSYKVPRRDLIGQVHAPEKVLDVGCNNGAVAQALKKQYPEARVWGIEINPVALQNALPYLEQGWVLDLDNTALDQVLGNLTFDTIIAGDVLEHTTNYEKITSQLYARLKYGGRLIISVPNYGHWHTLYVFFSRRWQRNERGIFDKTHRSIFMWLNLGEFAKQCPNSNWKIAKRNFRLFETNKLWKFNIVLTYLLLPLLIIPYINDFLTHSYVIVIDKPQRSA